MQSEYFFIKIGRKKIDERKKGLDKLILFAF